MVRDYGDRLDAIESVLVQLLAERFARQINPLKSLQAFTDRLHDMAGRQNDALQTLLELVDRRRKHIEQNRTR